MSLDAKLLMWAMVAQAALTFFLCGWMGFLRNRDFHGGLDPQAIALGEPKWSPRATQVANAFSNQFELPVLFYVVAILFLIAARPDLVVVILAWLFVLFRVLHALIHTGSNIVVRRGAVFALGLLAVLGLWIWFAVHLITAPA